MLYQLIIDWNKNTEKSRKKCIFLDSPFDGNKSKITTLYMFVDDFVSSGTAIHVS